MGSIQNRGMTPEDYDRFLSPTFNKDTENKVGKEKFFQRLDNVRKMAAVKLNRICHLLSSGKWINNSTASQKILKDIYRLRDDIDLRNNLLNEPGVSSKLKKAIIDDLELMIAGVDNATKILDKIKESGGDKGAFNVAKRSIITNGKKISFGITESDQQKRIKTIENEIKKLNESIKEMQDALKTKDDLNTKKDLNAIRKPKMIHHRKSPTKIPFTPTTSSSKVPSSPQQLQPSPSSASDPVPTPTEKAHRGKRPTKEEIPRFIRIGEPLSARGEPLPASPAPTPPAHQRTAGSTQIPTTPRIQSSLKEHALKTPLSPSLSLLVGNKFELFSTFEPMERAQIIHSIIFSVLKEMDSEKVEILKNIIRLLKDETKDIDLDQNQKLVFLSNNELKGKALFHEDTLQMINKLINLEGKTVQQILVNISQKLDKERMVSSERNSPIPLTTPASEPSTAVAPINKNQIEQFSKLKPEIKTIIFNDLLNKALSADPSGESLDPFLKLLREEIEKTQQQRSPHKGELVKAGGQHKPVLVLETKGDQEITSKYLLAFAKNPQLLLTFVNLSEAETNEILQNITKNLNKSNPFIKNFSNALIEQRKTSEYLALNALEDVLKNPESAINAAEKIKLAEAGVQLKLLRLREDFNDVYGYIAQNVYKELNPDFVKEFYDKVDNYLVDGKLNNDLRLELYDILDDLGGNLLEDIKDENRLKQAVDLGKHIMAIKDEMEFVEENKQYSPKIAEAQKSIKLKLDAALIALKAIEKAETLDKIEPLVSEIEEAFSEVTEQTNADESLITPEIDKKIEEIQNGLDRASEKVAVILTKDSEEEPVIERLSSRQEEGISSEDELFKPELENASPVTPSHLVQLSESFVIKFLESSPKERGVEFKNLLTTLLKEDPSGSSLDQFLGSLRNELEEQQSNPNQLLFKDHSSTTGALVEPEIPLEILQNPKYRVSSEVAKLLPMFVNLPKKELTNVLQNVSEDLNKSSFPKSFTSITETGTEPPDYRKSSSYANVFTDVLSGDVDEAALEKRTREKFLEKFSSNLTGILKNPKKPHTDSELQNAVMVCLYQLEDLKEQIFKSLDSQDEDPEVYAGLKENFDDYISKPQSEGEQNVRDILDKGQSISEEDYENRHEVVVGDFLRKYLVGAVDISNKELASQLTEIENNLFALEKNRKLSKRHSEKVKARQQEIQAAELKKAPPHVARYDLVEKLKSNESMISKTLNSIIKISISNKEIESAKTKLLNSLNQYHGSTIQGERGIARDRIKVLQKDINSVIDLLDEESNAIPKTKKLEEYKQRKALKKIQTLRDVLSDTVDALKEIDLKQRATFKPEQTLDLILAEPEEIYSPREIMNARDQIRHSLHDYVNHNPDAWDEYPKSLMEILHKVITTKNKDGTTTVRHTKAEEIIDALDTVLTYLEKHNHGKSNEYSNLLAYKTKLEKVEKNQAYLIQKSKENQVLKALDEVVEHSEDDVVIPLEKIELAEEGIKLKLHQLKQSFEMFYTDPVYVKEFYKKVDNYLVNENRRKELSNALLGTMGHLDDVGTNKALMLSSQIYTIFKEMEAVEANKVYSQEMTEKYSTNTQLVKNCLKKAEDELNKLDPYTRDHAKEVAEIVKSNLREARQKLKLAEETGISTEGLQEEIIRIAQKKREFPLRQKAWNSLENVKQSIPRGRGVFSEKEIELAQKCIYFKLSDLRDDVKSFKGALDQSPEFHNNVEKYLINGTFNPDLLNDLKTIIEHLRDKIGSEKALELSEELETIKTEMSAIASCSDYSKEVINKLLNKEERVEKNKPKFEEENTYTGKAAMSFMPEGADKTTTKTILEKMILKANSNLSSTKEEIRNAEIEVLGKLTLLNQEIESFVNEYHTITSEDSFKQSQLEELNDQFKLAIDKAKKGEFSEKEYENVVKAYSELENKISEYQYVIEREVSVSENKPSFSIKQLFDHLKKIRTDVDLVKNSQENSISKYRDMIEAGLETARSAPLSIIKILQTPMDQAALNKVEEILKKASDALKRAEDRSYKCGYFNELPIGKYQVEIRKLRSDIENIYKQTKQNYEEMSLLKENGSFARPTTVLGEITSNPSAAHTKENIQQAKREIWTRLTGINTGVKLIADRGLLPETLREVLPAFISVCDKAQEEFDKAQKESRGHGEISEATYNKVIKQYKDMEKAFQEYVNHEQKNLEKAEAPHYRTILLSSKIQLVGKQIDKVEQNQKLSIDNYNKIIEKGLITAIKSSKTINKILKQSTDEIDFGKAKELLNEADKALNDVEEVVKTSGYDKELDLNDCAKEIETQRNDIGEAKTKVSRAESEAIFIKNHRNLNTIANQLGEDSLKLSSNEFQNRVVQAKAKLLIIQNDESLNELQESDKKQIDDLVKTMQASFDRLIERNKIINPEALQSMEVEESTSNNQGSVIKSESTKAVELPGKKEGPQQEFFDLVGELRRRLLILISKEYTSNDSEKLFSKVDFNSIDVVYKKLDKAWEECNTVFNRNDSSDEKDKAVATLKEAMSLLKYDLIKLKSIEKLPKKDSILDVSSYIDKVIDKIEDKEKELVQPTKVDVKPSDSSISVDLKSAKDSSQPSLFKLVEDLHKSMLVLNEKNLGHNSAVATEVYMKLRKPWEEYKNAFKKRLKVTDDEKKVAVDKFKEEIKGLLEDLNKIKGFEGLPTDVSTNIDRVIDKIKSEEVLPSKELKDEPVAEVKQLERELNVLEGNINEMPLKGAPDEKFFKACMVEWKRIRDKLTDLGVEDATIIMNLDRMTSLLHIREINLEMSKRKKE